MGSLRHVADTPASLRDVAVLTGSYVGSRAIGVEQKQSVKLLLAYVKGDETTVDLQIQSSEDGGTTWATKTVVGSPTTGVSTLIKHTLTMTPADYDASETVELSVIVSTDEAIRVMAKATGGTPTGTLGITAVRGPAL